MSRFSVPHVDPNSKKKKKRGTKRKQRNPSGDPILSDIEKYCSFEVVSREALVSRKNPKVDYPAIATLVEPFVPGAIVPSKVNMTVVLIVLYVSSKFLFKIVIEVNVHIITGNA